MATSEMSGKHHILSVLVENKFGVLSRVAGLFARRGFNIVSLAVSPTEDERFSRMTIVVVLINNGYLGMVTQWQDMFFDGRRSHVHLTPDVPNYALLAEAYGGVGMVVTNEEELDTALAEALGCVGLRCETKADVDATIKAALEINDRPVVIDFRTDYREKVYPMVAAGTSNSDVILDPAHDRPGGRD